MEQGTKDRIIALAEQVSERLDAHLKNANNRGVEPTERIVNALLALDARMEMMSVMQATMADSLARIVGGEK